MEIYTRHNSENRQFVFLRGGLRRRLRWWLGRRLRRRLCGWLGRWLRWRYGRRCGSSRRSGWSGYRCRRFRRRGRGLRRRLHGFFGCRLRCHFRGFLGCRLRRWLCGGLSCHFRGLLGCWLRGFLRCLFRGCLRKFISTRANVNYIQADRHEQNGNNRHKGSVCVHFVVPFRFAASQMTENRIAPD